MRLLVFQHAPHEGLGLFQPLLEDDGHQITIYRPDLGGPAPDLSAFDGLWVLGGVVQVWQADELEWLANELEMVRQAVVELKMPIFGICLGHQMLAHVLGGEVGPARHPEIGISLVQLSSARPEFLGLDLVMNTFQWHSAEVTEPPPGGQVIASSEACSVQALVWGKTAYSVQFHPEVDHTVLRNWCQDPAVAEAFDKANGRGAMKACLSQIDAMTSETQHLAERLYRNWMARVSKEAGR